MNALPQTPAELAELWEREHIVKKPASSLRVKDVIEQVEALRKLGIRVNEVGRSVADRPIFQAEWGRGPLKVFMWSQMHGDEPTATPVLFDMLTIFHNNRDKDWVKQIEEKITLRVVPMLNPDGAELFIRRNLQGIDINRDAADLKTPEGRLLKSLRDAWQPDIGFNLHNQNYLTTVGQTDKQAAISFLVVFGDEAKTLTPGHERNMRLVAAMYQALNQFIPGNIGRYGDEWTPTAFGDNFSAWGTPTILIETGGLHGRDEFYLAKMNFVAFVTALRAAADGSEARFSPTTYEVIPRNSSRRIFYFIFRGATLIERAQPEAGKPADIGVNIERRRAGLSTPGFIRSIGDLKSTAGLEEFDVSGYNVIGRFNPVRSGAFADLLFYKKGRQVNWSSAELETEFPPDAIFSLGKWLKGGEDIPRIKR
jgi:hypothetical protein